MFCFLSQPHLVNISKQDISTEFITQLSQALFDPMNVCICTSNNRGKFRNIHQKRSGLEIIPKKTSSLFKI